MANFQEVKVILRTGNGDQAWMAEIDTSMPVGQLLPDLVQALSIDGEADDYELRNEGSLEKPVLILTAKGRSGVRGVRPIGPL